MTDADAEVPAARAPEPRANPNLIGHASAERMLMEAAGAGRVHHAWLITGPKGVGKATLAFRFAHWLLAGCGDAPPADDLFGEDGAGSGQSLSLDPEDPVFRRVAAGGHADLLTVARGPDDSGKRLRTEIVVADIRKVGDFLSLTAGEGGWRVVVIDGAEDMNRHAANALLKTLEEPPPRTVLLLVSHAPGRLPPTIRSRCRKLPLPPLEEGVVFDLLRQYRPDLAADEVALLAAMGEGSIGRALALADAGGISLYEELLSLLASLPRTEAAKLHGVTEAIARTRNEAGVYVAFDVFTDLLTWWIARLVRTRATGVMPERLAPGEEEVIARLGTVGNLDQWVEVWEKVTRLFGRASRVNLDRKQVLLNAFFALGRIGS